MVSSVERCLYSVSSIVCSMCCSEKRGQWFLKHNNITMLTQQTVIKWSALPQNWAFLGQDHGTSRGSPASHQWCWTRAEDEALARADPGEELARLHSPSHSNRSVLSGQRSDRETMKYFCSYEAFTLLWHFNNCKTSHQVTRKPTCLLSHDVKNTVSESKPLLVSI